MTRYLVHSGPLRIAVFAASAYDAALEAVRWWDGGRASASDAAHRSSLAAEIEVRACRSHRPARRFPTFRLLARAAGESPSRAWGRVLREHVGQTS